LQPITFRKQMKNRITMLLYWALLALVFISISCKKKAFTPPGKIVESKKRALLIGVEHTNAKPPRGTSFSPYATDDATSNVEFIELLLNFKGFGQNEVKTLISGQATSTAILDEISLAASDLSNGGLFIFYFTGHGLQIDGGTDFFPSIPESDGKDEAIAAFDKLIIDNQLYKAFSKFNSKTEVIMLFDCCHAGSIYALNYLECKPEICSPLERSEISFYKQQLIQNFREIQNCPTSLMRNVKGYDCKVLYLGSSFDPETTDEAKIAQLVRTTWLPNTIGHNLTYCDFINRFLEKNVNNVVVETSNNIDDEFLFRNIFSN
jgi:hypothetical protein